MSSLPRRDDKSRLSISTEPLVGLLQQRDAMQQCAFAGATHADDTENVAGVHQQINVPRGDDFSPARNIFVRF